MRFAAAETEFAVEELAGTIGFETASDGERAFGVGAGEKKGVGAAKHSGGRGGYGDDGNGSSAEICGISAGCSSDCDESRIRNGRGSGVESVSGNGAAILGGTIGAAETPRNGHVRGTGNGGGELLGRSNDDALRFGIDDDGNGFFATAQTEEVFDAVDVAPRAGKTRENQENYGESSHMVGAKESQIAGRAAIRVLKKHIVKEPIFEPASSRTAELFAATIRTTRDLGLRIGFVHGESLAGGAGPRKPCRWGWKWHGLEHSLLRQTACSNTKYLL